MTAHSHKLMRAYTVGKKNVILDRDVSRERNFIRKNIIVADHTVVRDVYAHHEEVTRTNPRRLARTIGPVKRAELSDDIVVADLEKTRLTFELHILRLAADYSVFKDAISGPEAGVLLDDGVSPDLAIWPDFDVIFDDGGWVDGHF